MTDVKTRPEDFAILGGEPAFAEILHVGRPNIGDRRRLLDRIEGILDRRWLTNNGPVVIEFEREVARRLGAKECVAACNGTLALEIAARALGFEQEVIVPSFTFIGTVHALHWQGITPVFCDIDPRTHNIDLGAVKRAITPRTTGILAVHLWGRPCDVEGLADLAAGHGLGLLFDSSHAFGCSHRGKMIGGLGHTEVFSFHATKVVNSFEGGVILTDDAKLASRMRLMRNFGFVSRDKVVYPGTNGKMTEVCAAMGLTSLESLDEFVAANRRNYQLYRSELAGVPGIEVLRYDEAESPNFHYVVCEVDAAECPFDRDVLVGILIAENVLARRYFWPGCHRMEPYRTLFPNAGARLPRTEDVARRVMLLPTGTAMGEKEIRAVCGLIRRAVELAPLLLERMEAGAPQKALETA